MVSTLIGSGAGPIAGYIAQGRPVSRFLNIYSFRKNRPLPTLLTTQPTDATDDVESVRWSGNGNFLVCSTRVGPRVYSRTGATFTALSIPSSFTSVNGDSAISADGSYISVVGSSSPYARIWFNNAGTLSALTNIGTIDTVTRSVAISTNGSYVAFLGNTSPTLLRIKVRSGSGNSAVFADMALASQPASGSGSSARISGVAFSPDDTYLAVCPAAQANQTIYKWNSGTSLYDRLTSPFVGALPDSTVSGCAWSPDGTLLAIATTAKTFFYERSGDTFTSVFNVATGYRGNFHPSGNYYISGAGSIYQKISSSNWSLVTSVFQTTTSYNYATAFSPSILTS